MIHQDVLRHTEYDVSTGGSDSTEVSLVAHAPTEEENRSEIKSKTPSPIEQKKNSKDFTQPTIKGMNPRTSPGPQNPRQAAGFLTGSSPKGIKKNKFPKKNSSPAENSSEESKETNQDSKEKNQGAKSGEGGNAIGSTSAKPDYLRNPPPEYPEESRDNHEEGIVILLVDVSEAGRSLDISLQKSSGFRRLDDSALRAVKNWKFKPATKNGSPIPSRVQVPVRFKLN